MKKGKLFLGAGILCMLLTSPAMAANENSAVTQNVVEVQQKTAETMKSSVVFDGGAWTWDGKAFHCWKGAGGKEITISQYIATLKTYNGYIKIGNNYYALNAKGVPLVGCQKLRNGYFYYFSRKGSIPGAMVKKTWVTENTKYGTWWRYYDASGKMRDFAGGSKYVAVKIKASGSGLDSKKFYVLNKNGYILGPNQLKLVKCTDGKEYYCYTGNDKALVSNQVVTVKGKKFFIKKNYKIARNEFVYYNGKYYYYGSNYQLSKNVFVKFKNRNYYVNSSGQAAAGAIKDSNGYITAYASPKSYILTTGWKLIDGNYYYFNENGRAVRAKSMKKGDTWGYINGKGHWIKAGWLIKKQSNGTEKRYYVSPQNGELYRNCWRNVGGLNYYFLSDGSVCTKVDRLPGVKFSGYNLSVNNQKCTITVYSSDWKTPIRVFRVSTGTDATPTPNGTFRITSTRQRWTTLMGPSYGQWASHFYGGCFMHSVPCSAPNVYTMGRNAYCLLGTKQSHGCIRMTVSDVYWVYTHCDGGTIRISNYETTPLGPGEHHWIPEGQYYDPTDWNVPQNHLSGPVWD